MGKLWACYRLSTRDGMSFASLCIQHIEGSLGQGTLRKPQPKYNGRWVTGENPREAASAGYSILVNREEPMMRLPNVSKVSSFRRRWYRIASGHEIRVLASLSRRIGREETSYCFVVTYHFPSFIAFPLLLKYASCQPRCCSILNS